MIDVKDLILVEFCLEVVWKLRVSFFVIGVFLGWKGEVVVLFFGGCNIGVCFIDFYV